MAQVLAFEKDVTWKRALQAVDARLYKTYNAGSAEDCKVACAVADVSGQDCPLVFISEEFERLTGYVRDWALGRNCRFLQPNDRPVNKLLNGDEVKRMREFCTCAQPSGSVMVNILVNESHNNMFPFWNVLLMEHFEV
eukprot:CAMPEP_0172917530 /NCGR_PEP_ID=MMETSP1075-20121228/198538_1 /TAXON_ID=2916 /ORGANISM="Ceratium fusus, Strain PA161109" /LENGTH=137 /DNA_ID=CAMNT_0013777027 /DNA_START=30 /DNA_END=439 /DNA_ORIENTATION=-